MNSIIKTLMTFDESQLLELFHDIAEEEDGIATVERIAACATHFENIYEKSSSEDTSEYQDLLDQDYQRRYREYRSAN